MNAAVSAGGVASTYWFEYGTSTSYGKSIPASPKSLGSGTGDSDVSEVVEVAPDTTYHYRVVVSNSKGTLYGEDKTFKTSTWSLQTNPTAAEGTPNGLSDVSCTSSTNCVAVGKKSVKIGEASYETRTFAARWNGTEWSGMTTPNVSGGDTLDTVSCASTTSCMAIGTDPKGPISARWNGSEWSLVSVPVPAEAKGQVLIKDLSCTSSTNCIAAGSYTKTIAASESMTLIERWNGSEWSIQSSPNPAGTLVNKLTGVSCSSSIQCMAVGSSKVNVSSSAGPLVETWE